jgi:hypothetical protein
MFFLKSTVVALASFYRGNSSEKPQMVSCFKKIITAAHPSRKKPLSIVVVKQIWQKPARKKYTVYSWLL